MDTAIIIVVLIAIITIIITLLLLLLSLLVLLPLFITVNYRLAERSAPGVLWIKRSRIRRGEGREHDGPVYILS